MSAKTILVGVLITASVPVLEALTKFNADAVTDWRAWVVGLGSASVRQAAAYLITKVVEKELGK